MYVYLVHPSNDYTACQHRCLHTLMKGVSTDNKMTSRSIQ